MQQALSARSSVYQRVHETARRVARRDPTVRDEADDIANDVVLSLARKEAREPGFVPNNPEAWATTAAVRQIIDLKRYRARRAGAKPEDPAADGTADPGDGRDASDDVTAAGRVGDAEGAAPRSATVEAAFAFVDPKRVSGGVLNEVLAEQALRKLGWTKREYLLMALVAEGFSYKEIAERLGYKSEASVRSMVARLRREAREVLGDLSDWMVASQSLA